MTRSEAVDRALASLKALSVGDAFGELFFDLPAGAVGTRTLPPGPWRWTDDTHMAVSITEALVERGEIDSDDLASRFARRFAEEPWRGYGGGAARLLSRVARGADWRDEAPGIFPGGSYGNGGAMRVAPLGAYFAADPERAAIEGLRSARVTHAHPEGQAGAIAVSAAAALRTGSPAATGNDLIEAVLAFLPAGQTRDGLEAAQRIEPDALPRAISELGTGWKVAAFDTVPFCLWMVAHHGDDFERCLWMTVSGMGDRDTTCAIVAGILGGARPPIPEPWLLAVEPLPEPFETEARPITT